jgi:hypothetical protein
LRFQTKGNSGNRQGVGAHFDIYANGKHIVRELQLGRGYHSTSDPVVHVGIGSASKADSVVVRWPDGKRQVLRNVPANSTTVVVQAAATEAWRPTVAAPYMQQKPKEFLPVQHRENAYDDFKRERLLPYRFSQDGPGLAAGDVNGDGRTDVLLTGAKYGETTLALQSAGGVFAAKPDAGFESLKSSEGVDVVLFDADGDKDLDALVVTGGNEFDPDDIELEDKLFINDGLGRFTESKGALPEIRTAGSRAVVADYDKDGDMDVFIGGRVIPGKFPMVPRSVLLRNNKGRFMLPMTSPLAWLLPV